MRSHLACNLRSEPLIFSLKAGRVFGTPIAPNSY
jgi:hypothetical protein